MTGFYGEQGSNTPMRKTEIKEDIYNQFIYKSINQLFPLGCAQFEFNCHSTRIDALLQLGLQLYPNIILGFDKGQISTFQNAVSSNFELNIFFYVMCSSITWAIMAINTFLLFIALVKFLFGNQPLSLFCREFRQAH